MLVEFVAGWSTSSKNIAPYLNTLAKVARVQEGVVRVDMEALRSVAEKANVKALPTYQLYRNGEKLEEMSGAMPAKLVAMLKTHHVKDKKIRSREAYRACRGTPARDLRPAQAEGPDRGMGGRGGGARGDRGG